MLKFYLTWTGQTRRDDLESLGYLLIYLYKGRFEWDRETFVSKTEMYTRIIDIKMTTPIEMVCKGIPRKLIFRLSS